MDYPQGQHIDAKIERLLQFDSSLQGNYIPERVLVALVLMTNSSLMPKENFLSVWLSHHHQFLPFCQCLMSDESPRRITLGRLIAALAGRLLSLQESSKDTDFDDKLKSSSELLINLALQCACELPTHDDAHAVQYTSEVLEVLITRCSIHRKNDHYAKADDILSKFLIPLWQVYLKGMLASGEDPQGGMEDNTADITDEQIMENTLNAIVQRSIGTSENTQPPSLQTQKDRLHRTMGAFYRNEVLAIITRPTKESDTLLPAYSEWLTKYLKDLSKSTSAKDEADTQQSTGLSSREYALIRLPTNLQQSWHETLLLFVKGLASHPGLTNLVENISSHLRKLLLLHVASPQQSGALRLLAWTTCAAWVDRLQEYDWMLINNKEEVTAKKNSLGSASQLCALIRLASGEWRIQLGYRLAEPTSKESSSAQERAGMIQGCAQVLASLVAYLGQIADDMESKKSRDKRSISPEALLHLRDSLEDTLQTTCNYLCQLEKASPIDKEDIVMMQLLGTLLTEFDVFDGLTNLDTDEILKAVAFSLKHGKDFDTKERLVTGMLGILESARGDSYRVLLLREHDLIGNSMASFLQSYWTSSMEAETSLRSIPFACHSTELWSFILTEHQSELRLKVNTSIIERAILTWMRHAMGTSQTRIGFIQALNAAVACFVTLHEEDPPSEEDGQILQGALQLCAMQS